MGSSYRLSGRSASLPLREVMPMEVKDALNLMLMFGMFVVSLLTYLKKK
jgi:hypothetical protein